MNKDKIFSDLADLAGGAATMFSALREQMRNDVKDRLDEWTERLDLVTRSDITRLEGMIEKLRARLDKLDKLDKSAGHPRSSSKAAPQNSKSAPARAPKKSPARPKRTSKK